MRVRVGDPRRSRLWWFTPRAADRPTANRRSALPLIPLWNPSRVVRIPEPEGAPTGSSEPGGEPGALPGG